MEVVSEPGVRRLWGFKSMRDSHGDNNHDVTLSFSKDTALSFSLPLPRLIFPTIPILQMKRLRFRGRMVCPK